jgi:hypothetical protein
MPHRNRSACCVRAAIGHVVAAPPTSVMNSRFLVSAGEQSRRGFEVEDPSRLQVDAQFELSRLHYGQICGARALEDTPRIDADLTVSLGPAGAVAHQAASMDVFGVRINGRNAVARCEKHQLDRP